MSVSREVLDHCRNEFSHCITRHLPIQYENSRLHSTPIEQRFCVGLDLQIFVGPSLIRARVAMFIELSILDSYKVHKILTTLECILDSSNLLGRLSSQGRNMKGGGHLG